VKKSFMYLVRLLSHKLPTSKSCIGISFAGIGRGWNELLIEVYADNIDEADYKLRVRGLYRCTNHTYPL